MLDITDGGSKHCLPQVLTQLGKFLGVAVMSDGLGHCPRPLLGVVALEDS